MIKFKIFFVVAIFATILLNSCGSKCDKSDPKSDCYEFSGDLVEINGINWAICNVNAPGVFAATPESAGMFYQWNRNIGWSTSDPLVSSNGDSEWDFTFPEGNEWTTANSPCPDGWRIPSAEDFQTLLDTAKVEQKFAKQKSISGIKFTDKASGKSLFFPAAGYRDNNNEVSGALELVGNSGFYWSITKYSNSAYNLYISDNGALTISNFRSNGLSVRCVEK